MSGPSPPLLRRQATRGRCAVSLTRPVSGRRRQSATVRGASCHLSDRRLHKPASYRAEGLAGQCALRHRGGRRVRHLRHLLHRSHRPHTPPQPIVGLRVHDTHQHPVVFPGDPGPSSSPRGGDAATARARRRSEIPDADHTGGRRLTSSPDPRNEAEQRMLGTVEGCRRSAGARSPPTITPAMTITTLPPGGGLRAASPMSSSVQESPWQGSTRYS
jgi:hypothetical protein